MTNKKNFVALVSIYLLFCALNATTVNSGSVNSVSKRINVDSSKVLISCCDHVIDSFYRNMESKTGLSDIITDIRQRACNDNCYGNVSFSIRGIDVDCDGIPDHVRGEFIMTQIHRISVFDENMNLKYKIVNHNNRGLFLGVIPLPFNIDNDSNYICTKRILNLLGINFPINPKGISQVKYLIKNSINFRRGRIPSDWMVDFDTTFQTYSCVLPSSVFSELGIDKIAWLRAYLPLSDYFPVNCDNPYSKDCPADSLFGNTKGFIFYYLAHNHLVKKYLYREISQDELFTKIPISNDLVLYQTAHGVLLRKGKSYKWIYHEDQVERLRWPTIDKVTVSEGGEITIFRVAPDRINLLYEEDDVYFDEEDKIEVDRIPKFKPLKFQLNDLR